MRRSLGANDAGSRPKSASAGASSISPPATERETEKCWDRLTVYVAEHAVVIEFTERRFHRFEPLLRRASSRWLRKGCEGTRRCEDRRQRSAESGLNSCTSAHRPSLPTGPETGMAKRPSSVVSTLAKGQRDRARGSGSVLGMLQQIAVGAQQVSLRRHFGQAAARHQRLRSWLVAAIAEIDHHRQRRSYSCGTARERA